MTVDGNENVDYLTKQAHLTIKGHGVYIVRGTEGKGKLTWKFEYLVDDRLDVNGLAMPGEKVYNSTYLLSRPSD